MLKKIIEFIKTREDCMKKWFQCAHDEGASGGHTRKHSKLVKALKRDENIFTVSHITVSFLVNKKSSNLMPTKSNSGIEPILSKISEIRNISDKGIFRRHEKDNFNEDANLWEVQSPTLLKVAQSHEDKNIDK